MSKTYGPPDAYTQAILSECLDRWHQRLLDAQVRIAILMVYPSEADMRKKEEEGWEVGATVEDVWLPVMTDKGHAVAAKVKIKALADRVLGSADAEVWIDALWWVRQSREVQLATMDHELTHLELVPPKAGDAPADLDDFGRPRLTGRHHDFQVGMFYEVAARHREHSLEAQHAAALIRVVSEQMWLPFGTLTPSAAQLVEEIDHVLDPGTVRPA